MFGNFGRFCHVCPWNCMESLLFSEKCSWVITDNVFFFLLNQFSFLRTSISWFSFAYCLCIFSQVYVLFLNFYLFYSVNVLLIYLKGRVTERGREGERENGGGGGRGASFAFQMPATAGASLKSGAWNLIQGSQMVAWRQVVEPWFAAFHNALTGS